MVAVVSVTSNSQRESSSHVSSAVELERSLEADDALDVLAGLELGQRLLSGVQTVDVCLVVLRVVKRHDLGRDRRLQRLPSAAARFYSPPGVFLDRARSSAAVETHIVGVRQGRQGVLASRGHDGNRPGRGSGE